MASVTSRSVSREAATALAEPPNRPLTAFRHIRFRAILRRQVWLFSAGVGAALTVVAQCFRDFRAFASCPLAIEIAVRVSFALCPRCQTFQIDGYQVARTGQIVTLTTAPVWGTCRALRHPVSFRWRSGVVVDGCAVRPR